MIKFFLLISLLAPPVAKQVPEKIKVPKNLTVKKATIEQLFKYCETLSESYQMPKTIYDPGPSVYLLRIDGCLETKSLLIVSWIGKSRKLDRIFTDLVVTHYATFTSERTKKQLTVKYIDTKSQKPVDPRLPPDFSGMGWYAFYDLGN